MYKLLENFKSFKVFLLKETIHSYYLSIKNVLFTTTFKRNYYMKNCVNIPTHPFIN